MKIGIWNFSMWVFFNEPPETVEVAPQWMTFSKQSPIDRGTCSDIATRIKSMENVSPVLDIDYEDESYKLVDIEHLEKWFAIEPTDKLPYEATDHDCDDFAVSVYGHMNDWDSSLASFLVKVRKENGGYHMMVGVIGTDWNVYLIEPQNDEFFADNSAYTLRKVYML